MDNSCVSPRGQSKAAVGNITSCARGRIRSKPGRQKFNGILSPNAYSKCRKDGERQLKIKNGELKMKNKGALKAFLPRYDLLYLRPRLRFHSLFLVLYSVFVILNF